MIVMPTFSVQHSYRFPRPPTSAYPLVTRGQPLWTHDLSFQQDHKLPRQVEWLTDAILTSETWGDEWVHIYRVTQFETSSWVACGVVIAIGICYLRLRLGSSLSGTKSGTHFLWNVLRFFSLVHLPIYIFFPFPHVSTRSASFFFIK